MRVGIDLDGVLYNFGDSVKRFLDDTDRGHLWKSGPTPSPFWDFYKDWGWSSGQFVDMCNEGADAGYIFGGDIRHTRENAVETMWNLWLRGHELIVITDRQFGSTPEVSHELTKQWWADNSFPSYTEIHFSSDKTCVPTDVFVEDKIENYDAIEAAGTPCFLINRAWNQVNDGIERVRIDDISEFVDSVSLIQKLHDFNTV